MTISLKAEKRDEHTKSATHQLRAEGKVPAVVYGPAVGQASIVVNEKELRQLLRTTPHAIVELDIEDNGKHPVMIQEIQRDKLNRGLLHIDFHQINMNEPIRSVVPLEFTGDPVGVRGGGILQIQKHEVEVRCLPEHLPAAITVDISELKVGGHLSVSEIPAPDNVELQTPPTEVLVTILAPLKEADGEEAPEPQAAEPETANPEAGKS